MGRRASQQVWKQENVSCNNRDADPGSSSPYFAHYTKLVLSPPQLYQSFTFLPENADRLSSKRS